MDGTALPQFQPPLPHSMCGTHYFLLFLPQDGHDKGYTAFILPPYSFATLKKWEEGFEV